MNGTIRTIAKNSLIFLTAFFSFRCGAELLNAQASFVVYQTDMTQWIQDQTNQWLTPNQVIAKDLEIQAPYHTTIKNLSWQGSASMNWTKNASTNVWTFDGQATNVTFYADDFEIHDTFPQKIGDSTVYIRVDAVCSNVSFSFPGQWKMHGNVATTAAQTAVNGKLQNFTVTMSNQVPVVKLGSCVGPTGLQGFLNSVVAMLYAAPATIQSAMATEVQTFINTQTAKIVTELGHAFTFNILGANVTFIPQSVSSLANGSWIFDGALMMNAAKGAGVKTVDRGYTDANLSDARASGFVIGNSLIPEILGFIQRAGLVSAKFTSNDVPAFQSFLQNRFQQFFAWGDLLNFNTTDVFGFNAAATSTIGVQSIQNTFPGIQTQIGVPVDVLMSAPSAYGLLPYVEFTSTAPMRAQLNAKAVSGALQVTYSVTSLPMTYAFRKEFQQQVRQITQGIAMDTISSAVQQALTSQVWSYTMPDSASPVPDYRLLFKDLISGTNTFRFEMSFQKK